MKKDFLINQMGALLHSIDDYSKNEENRPTFNRGIKFGIGRVGQLDLRQESGVSKKTPRINTLQNLKNKNTSKQSIIRLLKGLQSQNVFFSENKSVNKILQKNDLDRKDAKKIKEDIQASIKNVFLIYGHNMKLNKKIRENIESAGYNVLLLDEQSVIGGESIFQSIKRQASKCMMGVAICSADDLIIKGESNYCQARPNVYFETGYLYGLYGEYRVLVVKEENCINPSDLQIKYVDSNNLKLLITSLEAMSKL